MQSPLSVVLSLKDKNITGPENLVGKTVGYGGTALSEAVVKSMMEYVGADASDVNLIDVGFELMSSMTTGNVDATDRMPCQPEVAADGGKRALMSTTHGRWIWNPELL